MHIARTVSCNQLESPEQNQDQLESPEQNWDSLLIGRPTRQRYSYAAVLGDHWSRLIYVHLQKSTSGDETIEAKEASIQIICSH